MARRVQKRPQSVCRLPLHHLQCKSKVTQGDLSHERPPVPSDREQKCSPSVQPGYSGPRHRGSLKARSVMGQNSYGPHQVGGFPRRGAHTPPSTAHIIGLTIHAGNQTSPPMDSLWTFENPQEERPWQSTGMGYLRSTRSPGQAPELL